VTDGRTGATRNAAPREVRIIIRSFIRNNDNSAKNVRSAAVELARHGLLVIVLVTEVERTEVSKATNSRESLRPTSCETTSTSDCVR